MRKRSAHSSSQKTINVKGELKEEPKENKKQINISFNHQHRLRDDRLVSVQGSMNWRPLAMPFILLTGSHSMPLCTSSIYA
jgi:hypothetical protein